MDQQVIRHTSDSLIDLLGAQCSDLEQLLALARAETLATEEGKFTRVWDIVSERAAIAQRLDTYHRQIAELRGQLESGGQSIPQYDITNRVIELANLTLAQDRQTHELLTRSRDEALHGLKAIESRQAGTGAYVKGAEKGLAYSKSF